MIFRAEMEERGGGNGGKGGAAKGDFSCNGGNGGTGGAGGKGGDGSAGGDVIFRYWNALRQKFLKLSARMK
ncbi:MAG: hypothetical protein AB8B55_20710 [Mariniblastus sp.]